jgi:hypothetical protein
MIRHSAGGGSSDGSQSGLDPTQGRCARTPYPPEQVITAYVKVLQELAALKRVARLLRMFGLAFASIFSMGLLMRGSRGVGWLLAGSALLLAGSANASGKAGVRADIFISLTREAKEIYVAGITDALDEAGMLDCPPGTSYRQVITLAEAYIYKNRKLADSMWAATAVMQALKESNRSRVGNAPGSAPSSAQPSRRPF